MVPHTERHPSFVAGCFACKLRSINIAPSATPSRAGGAHAAAINATERNWDKDMPAYKRLRHTGVQPRSIDGAAQLEARASESFEITSGQLMDSNQRRAYKNVIEGRPV